LFYDDAKRERERERESSISPNISQHATSVDMKQWPEDRCDFVMETFPNKMAGKNGVFWDVRPYGSCKNRRFGGT
jgi:hypothetical protein